MTKYRQDHFDVEYYEGFARGGFRGYTWKKVKGEQVKKINFIKWHYRRFKVDTVLFAACAKGFEVRAAREGGYKAFGCDMSDYALGQASKAIKPYLKQADIRDLSIYRENEFDLVCAFDVIHIIDPETRKLAYSELNRIAKKGVLIRTRVLPAEFTECGYDGTVDGEKIFRETVQSPIVEMEKLNKFKMFHMGTGVRYVVWYAFGDEKYFPCTFETEFYRGMEVENDS